MKKYKGVIFDFNGTLFFDSKFHAAAWLKYTKEVLKIDITEDFYYKNMHGRTNPEIYRSLYNKEIPKSIERTFGLSKEKLYREICLQNGPLKYVDGAEQLFSFLNKKGVPNMIATGSEIENVSFYKEHMPIDKYFKGKLILDDGSFPGKPNPDIYLLAAKTIGVNPEDIIVAEDSHGGILAARAANIGYIVGVSEEAGNFKDKDLVNKVITDFYQFPIELLK